MTDTSKRVLLVGNGESFQIGAFFRNALENLQMEYKFADEQKYFKPFSRSLLGRGVSRLLQQVRRRAFNQAISRICLSFRPHVVLVIKGTYVSPSTLAALKMRNHMILVNYATDNPFNPASSSHDIVKAIPLYDLYV